MRRLSAKTVRSHWAIQKEGSLSKKEKRLRARFECTAIIIIKDKDQTGGFHYYVAVKKKTASKNTASKIIRRLLPKNNQCDFPASFYITKEDINWDWEDQNHAPPIVLPCWDRLGVLSRSVFQWTWGTLFFIGYLALSDSSIIGLHQQEKGRTFPDQFLFFFISLILSMCFPLIPLYSIDWASLWWWRDPKMKISNLTK